MCDRCIQYSAQNPLKGPPFLSKDDRHVWWHSWQKSGRFGSLFLNNVEFWSLFSLWGRFSDTSGHFWSSFRVDVAFTQERGPSQTIKNPKSTFYCIWSVFGGVSNLLPISADYSLKSQIGIGKNWVGPPPNYVSAKKGNIESVIRQFVGFSRNIDSIFPCFVLSDT